MISKAAIVFTEEKTEQARSIVESPSTAPSYFRGQRAFFGMRGSTYYLNNLFNKQFALEFEREELIPARNLGLLKLVDQYIWQREPEVHVRIRGDLEQEMNRCISGEIRTKATSRFLGEADRIERKNRKHVLAHLKEEFELEEITIEGISPHTKYYTIGGTGEEAREDIREEYKELLEEKEYAEGQGAVVQNGLESIDRICTQYIRDCRDDLQEEKRYFKPISEQYLLSFKTLYLYSMLEEMGHPVSEQVKRAKVLYEIQTARQTGVVIPAFELATQIQFSLNKKIPQWLDDEQNRLSALLNKQFSEQGLKRHLITLKKGTLEAFDVPSQSVH